MLSQAKQIPKLTVQEAAKIMGVTPRFLHMGLQHGKFPFGVAVKGEKRWSYYINSERFYKYMEGRDMARDRSNSTSF